MRGAEEAVAKLCRRMEAMGAEEDNSASEHHLYKRSAPGSDLHPSDAGAKSQEGCSQISSPIANRCRTMS